MNAMNHQFRRSSRKGETPPPIFPDPVVPAAPGWATVLVWLGLLSGSWLALAVGFYALLRLSNWLLPVA